MILNANSLDIPLADNSVQCVVTSPPYYGLRDYGTAKWEGGSPDCDHVESTSYRRDFSGNFTTGRDKGTRGEQPASSNCKTQYKDTCGKCGAIRIDDQIGLESTPDEYVAKLVSVFREVKRVLKDDGTLWLNLGDSYIGGKGKSGAIGADLQEIRHAKGKSLNRGHQCLGEHGITKVTDDRKMLKQFGIKPKDLIGIPWMVAFALRADGWYLRSEIIWNKPNPMPESVKDRPTKSHEQLFLLTKNADYFYDAEAIMETATGYDGRKDTRMKGSAKYANGFVPGSPSQSLAIKGHERWSVRKNDGTDHGGNGTGFQNHSGYSELENPYVRNKRSVWTINTQPTSYAHFATYPEKLVEPCVLAGTSAKGQCPKCGANWVRNLIVVDKPDREEQEVRENRIGVIPGRDKSSRQNSKDMTSIKYSQNGWQPTCSCGLEPVPNIVFDPFAGSGTTGRVAIQHGRKFIGCELNYEYIDDISRRRLTVDVMLPGILSNSGSEL